MEVIAKKNEDILIELLATYKNANRIRHGYYVKRSKRNNWTTHQEALLHRARKEKLAASKVLRDELKKYGLCVLWGNSNQVTSITTIKQRDYESKVRYIERRDHRARMSKRNAVTLINTLLKSKLV